MLHSYDIPCLISNKSASGLQPEAHHELSLESSEFYLSMTLCSPWVKPGCYVLIGSDIRKETIQPKGQETLGWVLTLPLTGLWPGASLAPFYSTFMSHPPSSPLPNLSSLCSSVTPPLPVPPAFLYPFPLPYFLPSFYRYIKLTH